MNKPKAGLPSWVGIALVVVVAVVLGYFFLSSETAKDQIPPHVTGVTREIYEWAQTPEGTVLLEQLPCYCGCKFEGHLHARHCFWRDNGDFDKHGITCSVCLDIAKKAKLMVSEGSDACTIRKSIDQFYLPNKTLATPTPMPNGCVA